MFYLELILAILCFFLFLFVTISFHFRNNNGIPCSWPLVGMLPTIALDLHRLPEKLTELLERSNGTIQLCDSVLFANMNLVATSNPANVRRIMSTSFWNYPKGTEFQQLNDILGVSLFNLGSDQWKYHRKIFHAFLSHQKLHKFMAKAILVNINEALIPFLDHVSEQELVVDLEDVFKRQLYDIACKLCTGYNPATLSIEFPQNSFAKAMDDACEAVFSRHLLPGSIWNLQSWLGIGKEKKLSDARETLHQIVSKYISMKQEELDKEQEYSKADREEFDVLRIYLTKHEVAGSVLQPEEVIRDNALAFMFAVQDTTSAALTWFLWLLAKNPIVEMKIREEIRANILRAKEGEKWKMSSLEDTRKLVYLHAALCESLRLYPPVPFVQRECLQGDILPSGHRIKPKTKVLISAYAMGRMKWIWGEDCYEFKPERWINEKGDDINIKPEPSNKFFTFSVGPRICPGKEMAFTLMKAVAATIIYNYHVQVIESSCPVIPKASTILHTKHGLMATVTSQWGRLEA